MRRYLASLTLAVVLIAGCGGGHHHPSRAQKVQHATGHRCNPTDQVMQCVLPPAPKGLKRGGTPVAYGVDFAWSCPNPAGRGFGASYLSYDTSKNWTRACVARYRARVAVWESGAARATGGYSAGYSDARAASRLLAALGAPAGQPFDVAVDCDCTGPQVASYFQGATAAEGGRVNAYGSYRVIAYLHARGLVGNLNWQTYAWSHGAWLPASIAPLEQYLNGTSVDYDRAIAANYGQWPYATPKPKPKPTQAQIARWKRAQAATRRVLARDVTQAARLAKQVQVLRQRDGYYTRKLAGA